MINKTLSKIVIVVENLTNDVIAQRMVTHVENPKICKYLSGTITPWQEHKSSQAVVVCNFQFSQCCFGTIKPHTCTIKVRTIRFKQETLDTNGTFRKFSQQ